MTRAQVGRLRALAEEASAYHKTTGMCEVPHTCGGCHWWSGYLAAIEEITRGVDPNTAGVDDFHAALVRARERLAAGAANRQRFADQDRPCPAEGMPTGSAGLPNEPTVPTPQAATGVAGAAPHIRRPVGICQHRDCQRPGRRFPRKQPH